MPTPHGGPAPLFEKDRTEKPAFAVYSDLVLRQWHTTDAGTTDPDGRFETRGFYGLYDITVSANGLDTSAHTALLPETGEITVVME